ncbi:hypothetical protein SD80_001480 [Scytonema tolypothrichoides VB-61278]|nr:hypothetical protein SD80_001480 [Scytonema tolypothrichoides VB-61278]
MPPLPLYLIFLIIVFVLIPSIAAILLRWRLYQHIVDEADKVKMLIEGNRSVREPSIVQTLKMRYEKASLTLDNVNTAALIDQVYSQKKIELKLFIFNKQVRCEQIDYFCRILPNLLLAFGLLGTFIGMTMNLSALSQTINQTTARNVSDLVAELEKPLQGMSVAFLTSLTGLFFSASLIVFNWMKNTSLAKYRLISSLEDYLDNVYQPTIDGHTRLDKAVDRMTSLQNEFLTNFGNNVRDVLEKSLGKVAKEIAEENKKANELARQVYDSFTQSSGTISAAAIEFKFAAETFKNSEFPQKLSEATTDLAGTHHRFSQSAASLAETVISIATAVSEVQRCSQELLNLGEEIKSVHQTSVSVLELHQTNQNSLGQIIPQLKQGAKSFSNAINRLDNLEKRIVNKADSWEELVKTIVSYTEQVNSAIESLIGTNNQKVETVIAQLEGYANELSVKVDTFKLDLMELIRNNDVKVISEYQKMGKLLLGGLEETTEHNIKSYQVLMAKVIRQISDIQQVIYQLRDAKTSK